jgi:hypothetical protein
MENETLETKVARIVSELEKEIPAQRSVSQSSTQLDQTIVAIFKGFGKPMTAKEIQKKLPEKSGKWFSDRLWALKQKSLLVSPSRGYYQYPTRK